jgi:hypothetical protein
MAGFVHDVSDHPTLKFKLAWGTFVLLGIPTALSDECRCFGTNCFDGHDYSHDALLLRPISLSSQISF